MRDSEWIDHDSQYASWDHMRFSLWDYKNPDFHYYQTSVEKEWWGTPVKWDSPFTVLPPGIEAMTDAEMLEFERHMLK